MALSVEIIVRLKIQCNFSSNDSHHLEEISRLMSLSKHFAQGLYEPRACLRISP